MPGDALVVESLEPLRKDPAGLEEAGVEAGVEAEKDRARARTRTRKMMTSTRKTSSPETARKRAEADVHAHGEPQELEHESRRRDESAAAGGGEKKQELAGYESDEEAGDALEARKRRPERRSMKSRSSKAHKELRKARVSSSIVDCDDDLFGQTVGGVFHDKQRSPRSAFAAGPQEDLDGDVAEADDGDAPQTRSQRISIPDLCVGVDDEDDEDVEAPPSTKSENALKAARRGKVDRAAEPAAAALRLEQAAEAAAADEEEEGEANEGDTVDDFCYENDSVRSENIACVGCWSGIWRLLRCRGRKKRTARSRPPHASRKGQTMAEQNSASLLSDSESEENAVIDAALQGHDLEAERAERRRAERARALSALHSPVWAEFMDRLEARDLEGVRRVAACPEIADVLPVWRNSSHESILHVLCRTQGAAIMDAILSSVGNRVAHFVVCELTERGRGMLPLHVASAEGDADCVRVLLRHGAVARCQRDDYGLTALHRAAGHGYDEVCRILLEAGADSLIRDNAGFTAWHRACFHGRVGVLKALMRFEEEEYGSFARFVEADARLTSRGRSALHHVAGNTASGAQCEEMVRLLVRGVGVDIDKRCREGRTPLHDAALSGNLYAVDALLRYGANANARIIGSGSTPLHLAVENFQIGVCATLLQHPDIDLNVEDAAGLTPEMLAVDESRYDILDVFGSPEIARARAKNKALRRDEGPSSPRHPEPPVQSGTGASARRGSGPTPAGAARGAVAVW